MPDTLSQDYFPNHRSPDRFPFSLYHGPIRRSTVEAILRRAKGHSGEITVLNVGCGFSHILEGLPHSMIYLGCDLDPRTIDHCRLRFSGRNARFEVCGAYQVPFEDACADVVISTEVIEHVEDTQTWLKEIHRTLRPGGTICLSTPNYGGWLLPAIESTFLEWIARRQGFTRKGIHPTPFDATSLKGAISKAGFEDIKITKTPGHLALVATGRKCP